MARRRAAGTRQPSTCTDGARVVRGGFGGRWKADRPILFRYRSVGCGSLGWGGGTASVTSARSHLCCRIQWPFHLLRAHITPILQGSSA